MNVRSAQMIAWNVAKDIARNAMKDSILMKMGSAQNVIAIA